MVEFLATPHPARVIRPCTYVFWSVSICRRSRSIRHLVTNNTEQVYGGCFIFTLRIANVIFLAVIRTKGLWPRLTSGPRVDLSFSMKYLIDLRSNRTLLTYHSYHTNTHTRMRKQSVACTHGTYKHEGVYVCI